MSRALRVTAVLMLFFAPMFLVSCAKKAVTPGPENIYEQSPVAGQPDRMAPGGGLPGEQSYQAGGTDSYDLQERQRSDAMRQEILATKSAFEDEDIYFEFDSSALTSRAQAKLRDKAMWLQRYPSVSVIIEGHCDERGTSEYNLALGDRRAEGVKNYLVNLGVSPARMVNISYGEERPKDPGQNEAAWARNRRAHLVVE